MQRAVGVLMQVCLSAYLNGDAAFIARETHGCKGMVSTHSKPQRVFLMYSEVWKYDLPEAWGSVEDRASTLQNT